MLGGYCASGDVLFQMQRETETLLLISRGPMAIFGRVVVLIPWATLSGLILQGAEHRDKTQSDQ